MRVLVVVAPFAGHAYPVVPLAWELRTAGHDVLVATAGPAVRAADAGLPVADVARHFDPRRTRRRVALRNPALARAARTGRGGTRALVTLLGEINDELADSTVALADQWGPELVVYGALAPVGALVAARHDVPGVLFDHTMWDGRELSFATTGHLEYACGRHGVTAPATPTETVRLAPPSVAGDRSGFRMRYVPYDGGWVTPAWLVRPHPTRIAMVHSSPDDTGGVLERAVLRAAPSRDADAELVLLRPDLGPRTTLPAGVRTLEWTGLDALLPGCAAIVHHGGTETLLAALAHGVPQLVVPDSAETRHNARLLRRRGAGFVARSRDLSAGLLRRLVSHEAVTTAAAEVRVEMAAGRSPAEVADMLGDLPAGQPAGVAERTTGPGPAGAAPRQIPWNGSTDPEA